MCISYLLPVLINALLSILVYIAVYSEIIHIIRIGAKIERLISISLSKGYRIVRYKTTILYSENMPFETFSYLN